MKACELLADPAKWVKGTMAEAAGGRMVAAASKDAVCWCALGALRVCYGPISEQPYRAALARVHAQLPPEAQGNLLSWQDRPERTHAEVLDLLRRADV